MDAAERVKYLQKIQGDHDEERFLIEAEVISSGPHKSSVAENEGENIVMKVKLRQGRTRARSPSRADEWGGP